MMFRCLAASAVLAVVGAASVALASTPQSLWLDQLGAHDRLEVRTADYYLRFDMLDPSTGEALGSLSHDGVHFGPADRVFVLGATKGRHAEGLMFVRMGQVAVGKRLELAVRTMGAADRRITAPVLSLGVTSAALATAP